MIQIENLQKIVGQRTALSIELLNVTVGEIAAVVGPADSGIETLFESLIGIPKERAYEVLAQIGMADQANASRSRLPTSLLRRLAFGRAILHNPQVLLLCEPFARCDEATIAFHPAARAILTRSSISPVAPAPAPWRRSVTSTNGSAVPHFPQVET